MDTSRLKELSVVKPWQPPNFIVPVENPCNPNEKMNVDLMQWFDESSGKGHEVSGQIVVSCIFMLN